MPPGIGKPCTIPKGHSQITLRKLLLGELTRQLGEKILKETENSLLLLILGFSLLEVLILKIIFIEKKETFIPL